MKMLIIVAAVVAAFTLTQDSQVDAHDGTNGYISWSDAHWNASGTNHIEYDWYYTGHEGCQGNDACVYELGVQRFQCIAEVCYWAYYYSFSHGTVHAWQYDHSAVDDDDGSSCQSLTHYDGWDCHNQDDVAIACGYYYRHQPHAIDPAQYPISTGPYSNPIFRPC